MVFVSAIIKTHSFVFIVYICKKKVHFCRYVMLVYMKFIGIMTNSKHFCMSVCVCTYKVLQTLKYRKFLHKKNRFVQNGICSKNF